MVKKLSFWSKMVNKKTQFLVKNGQKKSEYFLIRIFWIGQDPPHPLVKKWSKKFWSKMVRNGKKTQFLVKNGQKKSKNFLIRIFWISRGAPLFDWK